MKNTLEKLLAEANPESGKKKEDIDSLLKHHAFDSGFWMEIGAGVKAKNNQPLHELSRRWETLTPIIGLLFRLRSEFGCDAFQMIGLTTEEDKQVLEAMILLKSRIINYKKHTRKSNTQMLYDQVSSIGY